MGESTVGGGGECRRGGWKERGWQTVRQIPGDDYTPPLNRPPYDFPCLRACPQLNVSGTSSNRINQQILFICGFYEQKY